LVNILFYYFLFGYNVYFYTKLNSFNSNISQPKFNSRTNYIDMQPIFDKYNYIIFLNCANFLVFIFVFLNNLKLFSLEFHIIQKNLAEVKIKIYSNFNLFFLVFLENFYF